MSCWRSGACACLLGLLCASPVQAFSDPFAFTDAPELGGGGGRWFTGSRADAYACNACHYGGEPVEVTVEGLPLSGHINGAPYEVTVRWPPGIEHMTLIAEFTNADNQAAGTIRLPRPDALADGELCSEEYGPYPAAEIEEPGDGRQLLAVIDCGAELTRFLWSAPEESNQDVWFNLGLVSADGDGDATGDGVTLIAQPLPSRQEGEPGPTELVQGCAVSGTAPGGRTGWTGLGCAWLALVLGRLSKRSGAIGGFGV